MRPMNPFGVVYYGVNFSSVAHWAPCSIAALEPWSPSPSMSGMRSASPLTHYKTSASWNTRWAEAVRLSHYMISRQTSEKCNRMKLTCSDFKCQKGDKFFMEADGRRRKSSFCNGQKNPLKGFLPAFAKNSMTVRFLTSMNLKCCMTCTK